ncbi:S-type anion channel SLAH2-like [Phalaenopsis equestris]|uniref:S-type anion channel SLAH2-like n=1 Tax=Phalaenopsis equestris TaxID=78828 RepID=UPI0009E61521|nr:S-type anion channel SLAH2-like [Phalaenopsis equestris]
MENQRGHGSFMNGFPQDLPPLFKRITADGVVGFDASFSSRRDSNGTEVAHNCDNPAIAGIQKPSFFLPGAAEAHNRSHSVSFGFQGAPSALCIDRSKIDILIYNSDAIVSDERLYHSSEIHSSSFPQKKQTMFHSQRMPVDFPSVEKFEQVLPSGEIFEDESYDCFRTWSGKLENRISNLHRKPQDQAKIHDSHDTEFEALPSVDRYYDAFEAPELEVLKAGEELVLPADKTWPFLLRFPVSSFGMCLGVSSQAMLWKTFAKSSSLSFLNVSTDVNLVLWFIALALIVLVATIYSLKIIFYFEAVKREYFHPVRINFFFSPWIACLFLAIGVPQQVTKNLPCSLWYVLMAPILCLELKIYGQWMSGGERRLSKVANPSNHLSILGNFVGALLGASMGLKEGPVFFFAVGLAHYIVLFVTLYQRLPTNEALPKELHPVFFLFIAAPSVASISWAKINGSFDLGSRIAFFIAMFLYASLAVRINFFRGFRFSLAWWAYTFPMTGAAIATITYTAEVSNAITKTLAITLSTISAVTVSALLVSTILHAFVFHNLFPNDSAIAISYKRPKLRKEQFHPWTRSSEGRDNESV